VDYLNPDCTNKRVEFGFRIKIVIAAPRNS
jgi:hypothetical protein